MIELGEGVDANMDDVVSFLEKIGLEGNLFAQTFLGDIYRLGEYHQNLEKSYFWYSEAAKQGDDRSQYFVGTMSVNGIGTYQNIPKGTGDAVLKTKKYIKDRFFLMLLPDDLIIKKNCSKFLS